MVLFDVPAVDIDVILFVIVHCGLCYVQPAEGEKKHKNLETCLVRHATFSLFYVFQLMAIMACLGVRLIFSFVTWQNI